MAVEVEMYSLRISGAGINVEKEIDQRTALQVVQLVMGVGSTASKEPSVPSSGEGQQGRAASLSLREYLDEIGASKKPDQIATIARYICDHEGRADFDREDIRTRFSNAREPLPGNFARDFGLALKKGWIAEAHGKKGRFYVTAKGVQAITSKFSHGRSGR